MNAKYLLDTNILSEPARPRPRAPVLDWLTEKQSQSATASVVWHELRYGAIRLPESKRRRKLLRYLDEVVACHVPILEYDACAAEWHAEERARLERLGETPPFSDGQIASIASTRGLVLVTLNLADFRRFHSLKLESPLNPG